MPISEQEQKDLDILHEEQAKERRSFSSLQLSYLDMDETMLKHSGHKSVEAALLYGARDHRKKLNKLVANHIKKYPD